MLFRFIVLTVAKIRIISQSYSLLPLKVTKRHEKERESAPTSSVSVPALAFPTLLYLVGAML
jgi:hypothetical protein